ncbi:hypothetical protein BGX23_004878 [Mortierella sp. AD031]|nr:hypothetical protein BGX23_004878 [Mortierella sp. AD031]
MDAATIRFFNIPELVIRLPVHLTRQDISRLTRTNKDLWTWCTPALYFSIDLNYHHYKPALFLSTASTLALVRKVHWVRQVEFHWFDLVYYFNCVPVYQDLRTQAGDPPPDRPLWLPPPDPSARPPSPVPPMTQRHVSGSTLAGPTPSTIAPINCQAITTLEPPLCNLRYLHLELICDTEKVATFGTDIFFGCPPSIEQLRIDIKHVPDARYCDIIMVYMNPWHHYDSHSDKSDDDIAGNSDDNNLNSGSGGNGHKRNKIYRYYEKTTLRRKDPLLNLVDLWLWDMCSDAIDENLQSIYQHCPRVERISGPYLYKELMETQDMVQLIGQGYTSLRSIIFESEPWQVNHRLPFKISVALPEQQLEEFRCDLEYGGLDETMARLAFQRHSTSLRRLMLQGDIYIKSGVLRVIFTTCVSLDSFEVSKDGNHGRLLIGLPDAVTSPWACTKI